MRPVTKCPDFVRYAGANWIVVDSRVVDAILYLVIEPTAGSGVKVVRAEECEVLK